MLNRRLIAALAALLGLLGSPPPAATAQAGKPSGVEAVLTAQTIGFIHVRPADVWASDTFKPLKNYVAHAGKDLIAEFERKFTPLPSDLESITFVLPNLRADPIFPQGRPTDKTAIWVATTRNPFDRVALMRSLSKNGRTKVHANREYLFEEDRWGGLLILDDRTVAYGSEDAILELIDQMAASQGDSPLVALFRAEGGRHPLLAGVNVAALVRPEMLRAVPDDFQAILSARLWSAAVDLAPQTRLTATLSFTDETKAKAGEKAFRAVLEMGRGFLGQAVKYLDEKMKAGPNAAGLQEFPESVGLLLGIAGLRQVDLLLKDMPIEVQGSDVRAALPLDAVLPGGATAFSAFWVAMATGYAVEQAGRQNRVETYKPAGETDYESEQQKRNLKKIAEAIEKYRRDKGHFPPSAILGKDGRPTLSWRVAILPYLEGVYIPSTPGIYYSPRPKEEKPYTVADLYRDFNPDEPWDGPTNKKLLERMPDVFRRTGYSYYSRDANWKTPVQAAVGKGLIFDPSATVKETDVADGLNATLLLLSAEAPNKAVVWTKPADVQLTDDGKWPADGPKTDGRMTVVFANGAVKRYPSGIKGDLLRSLLTRAGGESVDPKDLPPPERMPPMPPNFDKK